MSEDPICRLDMRQRLRLCNIVLNASKIDGEITFELNYQHVVDSFCTKREISFQDDIVRAEWKGKRFEEWMIGCTPKE